MGDLVHLRTGAGRWRDTPEGHAARNLAGFRAQLERAQHQATSPDLRRRDRRAATRAVERLDMAVAAAERRWQAIGEPRVQELQAAVDVAEHDLTRSRIEEVQRRLALGYDTPDRGIPERGLDRTSVAERLVHLETESPGIELGF